MYVHVPRLPYIGPPHNLIPSYGPAAPLRPLCVLYLNYIEVYTKGKEGGGGTKTSSSKQYHKLYSTIT